MQCTVCESIPIDDCETIKHIVKEYGHDFHKTCIYDRMRGKMLKILHCTKCDGSIMMEPRHVSSISAKTFFKDQRLPINTCRSRSSNENLSTKTNKNKKIVTSQELGGYSASTPKSRRKKIKNKELR